MPAPIIKQITRNYEVLVKAAPPGLDEQAKPDEQRSGASTRWLVDYMLQIFGESDPARLLQRAALSTPATYALKDLEVIQTPKQAKALMKSLQAHWLREPRAITDNDLWHAVDATMDIRENYRKTLESLSTSGPGPGTGPAMQIGGLAMEACGRKRIRKDHPYEGHLLLGIRERDMGLLNHESIPLRHGHRIRLLEHLLDLRILREWEGACGRAPHAFRERVGPNWNRRHPEFHLPAYPTLLNHYDIHEALNIPLEAPRLHTAVNSTGRTGTVSCGA